MEFESTAFNEFVVDAVEYILDSEDAPSVSCLLVGGSLCCL
jgi:hypothetical protein